MGMSNAGSREINVTPLIDVLLVLLIIFLVMMPIMLRKVVIELPPNTGAEMLDETHAVKLDADLSASIDDGPQFPNRELPARLRPQIARSKAVFVDFVDGVPWSHVVATVDTVRGLADELRRTDLSVAVRIHAQ
jgi:biopolymer transport protein ExbD